MNLQIMRAIYESSIANAARVLALYLAYRADSTGASWAGNDTTLRECAMCQKTYRQAKRHLVNNGLLTVALDAKGETFILNLAAIEAEKISACGGKNFPENGKKLPGKREKFSASYIQEGAMNKHELGAGGFSEFWETYPRARRGNKKQCESIWIREHLETRAPQVIAALVMQKNSAQWTKDAGQYIPSAVRWLGENGFENNTDDGSGSRKWICVVCGELASVLTDGKMLCRVHREETMT